MTTWNPSDKNTFITLSNGNLTATGSTGVFGCQLVRSIASVSSGKHYAEQTLQESAERYWLGVCNSSIGLNAYAEVGNSGITAVDRDSQVWQNGSYQFNMATAANDGDILQIAIDRDAGKFWIGVNGTFNFDPAAGTGGINLPSGDIFLAFSPVDDSSSTLNVGPTFAFTPPAGFGAWAASAPITRSFGSIII